MDTEGPRAPFRKDSVPSLGSTTQTWEGSAPAAKPSSSPRNENAVAAECRLRTIRSASVSTSAWSPAPRGPPGRYSSARRSAPASRAAAIAAASA